MPTLSGERPPHVLKFVGSIPANELKQLVKENIVRKPENGDRTSARMCTGNHREDRDKKKPTGLPRPRASGRPNYSQMFRELEVQLLQYRALMMRRLVRDPFYVLMNLSTASRMWMLRYLKHLAEYAEVRYQESLLQYFESFPREEVLNFFRSKNAPNEVIATWIALHPENNVNGAGPSDQQSDQAS